MKVNRSKSGLPTITESGGGMTNTGGAKVVCGPNGERLKPLFVPRGYSNDDHAIFVVKPGQTHIVSASHGKWGEAVRVERVVFIDEDDSVSLELIGEYADGDGNIPSEFKAAAQAALKKAKCYHCREVHYAA